MAAVKNRLAGETSPYLKQHASNPVDWYPWGEEALALAQRENKPILLSVGYSACHWCHVMAHESFEDQETAALMNRLFVNIKVDREERPDLDKIYQTAHQILTQRAGGWPLTMFLSPHDQTPFFGGTYFPPEPRYGMPGFKEILQRVTQYYQEQGEDISRQTESLRDVFKRLTPVQEGQAELTGEPLTLAREALEQQFDAKCGGFGDAPKFPHATGIERLLRHWRDSAQGDTPDVQALYMAAMSMQRMIQGGIFDQVGGGFCRYSVDEYWMIPHFEKMLYDNGPLLALCTQLWQATGDELYRRAASQTADWALREMRSVEGGFYSALDADSEGEEGRFYVWTPEQLRELLDAEQYPLFAAIYGLDRPPNFEGSWHLHTFRNPEEVAGELGMSESHAQHLLEQARARLLAHRDKRVRPARDEKILTAWNGLMIRGLAMASRGLGRPELAAAATEAADFIHTRMWKDGRLLASYTEGSSRFSAYLDDYAFLAEGLMELLQCRWRSDYLAWITNLADCLLEHFQDTQQGGFFFTADDQETLIHRPKSLSDDSTPSGNAVAASVLRRLGLLLGEQRYLDASERALQAAWPALQRYPYAHCSHLQALEERVNPVEILIIRGRDEQLDDWQETCQSIFAPRRMVFAIPFAAKGLPEGIQAKAPRGEVVAYHCLGMQCSAPLENIQDLLGALADGPGEGPKNTV
jgi:uncharacterized protein YyaL (SSP411 family)